MYFHSVSALNPANRPSTFFPMASLRCAVELPRPFSFLLRGCSKRERISCQKRSGRRRAKIAHFAVFQRCLVPKARQNLSCPCKNGTLEVIARNPFLFAKRTVLFLKQPRTQLSQMWAPM